jgi:recombination protein RecA
MAAAKAKTEETKSGYQKQVDILNKLYGPGTIIAGTDEIGDLEVVDSGSLTLNMATKIGGLPVGKLIEIYGPESSGKSTCCLHFISQFQKAGKKCLMIDYEYSFDKHYAKDLGVDIDAISFSQPDYMEAGYDIISRMIQSGEVGLVILDSHTAAPPKRTFEEELDNNATMALQARINSQALLKIKPLLLPNKCTMIAVSQLRAQIGAMTPGLQPTGGNSYKFYSDMRFKIWKKLDAGKETNRTTIDVVKKQMCPTLWQSRIPH